ncbi:MAG: hypothetical protein U5L76_04750 [Patescibacteria group bacterium]|nr:hypothetical protein [Patescibacteria group bacterium]
MAQRINISRAKKHLSGLVTRGGRGIGDKRFGQILKSNKNIKSNPTLRKAADEIARNKSKKSTVSRNTFKRLSKAIVKHGREGFEGSGVKRASLSKKGREVTKAHKSFIKKVVNEQKEAEKPQGPTPQELEKQKKREQALKNLNIYRQRKEIEKEQGRFNPRKSGQSSNEEKQEENKENTIDQPSSVPLSSGGIPQPNEISTENREYFSPDTNDENLGNTDKKSDKISSLEEKRKSFSDSDDDSDENLEEPPDEGLFAA